MSHSFLAGIWLQLVSRHDICNITCELMGDHAQREASNYSKGQDIGNLSKLSVKLKAIFDLQRTYISPGKGRHTERAKSTRFLGPDETFKVLIYLLRCKSLAEKSIDHSFDTETVLYCVLSGLRLLLISEPDLKSDQLRVLAKALDEAWKIDHLVDYPKFIVKTVFEKILIQLHHKSLVSEQISGLPNLPHYDGGLVSCSYYTMPYTNVVCCSIQSIPTCPCSYQNLSNLC
jgi:hypothetical protein